MNESTVVHRIISYIKKRLPHAVVFKHNDMSTAGIPDISVTYHGHTTWLEVKMLHPDATKAVLQKHLNPLQLATMYLLEKQGRAFYLWAYLKYRKVQLVRVTPSTAIWALKESLTIQPGQAITAELDRLIREVL